MKKVIPILLIINTSLFIISLAISFTILFRPFYYLHINALDLPSKTGFSYNEIKESYDDVLDYCIFNKPFSTGNLKYSEEGKDHFRDCKRLFIFNFIVLGITSIIIIIKKKWFSDIKFLRHSIGFCSSMLTLGLFIIITLISAILGFNKSFTLFHNILFMGKDNWLFNSTKDEIIKILPERYFMNCGLLIIFIICIISLSLIINEIYKKKYCQKKVNNI